MYKRQVQKIKRAGERNFHRLQASRAAQADAAFQLADQADVIHRVLSAVVLPNQLGVPLGCERANLLHLGAKVNLSGLKLQLELLLAQFQVCLLYTSRCV